MVALKASFLVGPTASGKTAVAQWIAEHHPHDILSADSMVVYRGMDVGTAKPSPYARGNVRYWGLDLVALMEPFSVGMFREYALKAMREVNSAGCKIIVAGGTGLYIKALTHGLNPLPTGNAALRDRAETVLKTGGITALQEWVKSQAPENYASLSDKENPRRLIRALEVAGSVSGGKPRAWSRSGQGGKLAGLLLSKEDLAGRIMTRVRGMYTNGLLEEVEGLMHAGLESAPTSGKAIGYAEAIEVLRGRLSVDQAIEITATRTRQLAKRQMTWFRRQADVEWIPVEPGMSIEQTGRLVMACWEKTGPAVIAEL